MEITQHPFYNPGVQAVRFARYEFSPLLRDLGDQHISGEGTRPPASTPPQERSVVAEHRAGKIVKQTAPQDAQTRSRLVIGEDGPSDSARAAARGAIRPRW